MPALVDSSTQATENIRRYQLEIRRRTRSSDTLVERMTNVRKWYAVEADNGTWLFGPSKFIGYVGLTAETYVEMSAEEYEPAADRLDGKGTKRRLQRWFEPSTSHSTEIDAALKVFLVNEHNHARPNAGAEILVLRDAHAQVVKALPPRETGDRICIDQAICGGRPHIRDTRIRVSDILNNLADGVSQQDILANHPDLTAADLKAALAFGAAASDHRIVLAA